MTTKRSWPFMLLALGLASPAGAADQLILGNRLVVADPTGLEDRRKIVAVGKESPSSIAAFSNPTTNGATLSIVANGGTSTSASYVLDASGWKAISGGYAYRGPTGGDGDPVRSVKMKRSSSGRVQLKVQVKGTVGVQDVTVRPPNPGDDGGIALQVIGGDRYCVAFGSGAGGTESRDNAQQWKVVKAVAKPGCPSVPTTTTTSTPTTTTVPGPSPLCPMDPTRTTFAGGPGTAACRDFEDQASCVAAFHMSDCGPASCFWDFDSFVCKGCGPNNEQSGQCVNTCTHGQPSCPGDQTRTIFAGYSQNSSCGQLSYSQTLCEKAFQIDGVGQPASCWFDTNSGDCSGCGPNNLDSGLCQNTCPVCEGDPTHTLFAGGPGNAGCHKFDGAQASCEGAFIMSGDSLAYTSCYYDGNSAECRGCGRNNQAAGECINGCPVCTDPSRPIFVGGPRTSACDIFDNSPSLCEQSFHMSGDCNELASCFYDYENGRCAGCGPNNKGAGLCQNECSVPICGNGIVDVAGEECDLGAGTCGGDEVCRFDCSCAPCASSTIPPQGGTFFGTTSGGSSLAGSCGSGTDVAPEAVFQWTPANTGQATIDLCGGTDFDSVLYLKEGSCNGLEVDCDDDSSCGLASKIFPFVNAGTTYFIVVDGYGGDSGNFTLTVTPASPSGAFLD